MQGALMSAEPRLISEAGIVEIILRIRVDGPRFKSLAEHNRDLQQTNATTATHPKP